MTGFAQRAQELLDAAVAGRAATEMTILICHDGSIQLFADSDWPLESLMLERGSRSGYRVSPARNRVRVEGRDGHLTCVLESPVTGAGAARTGPAPSVPIRITPWFPVQAHWLRA